MTKILIIGGPGNISSSCIDLLLEQKNELAIFTIAKNCIKNDKGLFEFFIEYDGLNVKTPYLLNSPLQNKIKFFFGDRNNFNDINLTVKDFKPDIVIDFICFLPDQAKIMIDVLYNNVFKYIFVSTVDVYGYPLSSLPITEEDRFNMPVSDYAKNKLLCETILKEKFDFKKFPLIIVRPSYSFGPLFLISFFSRLGGRYLIPRIRKKMPVVVPSDGKALFSFTSAYNTGRMIANIAISEKTIGKEYNCAFCKLTTQDDYINLIGKVVGIEPNIVHIPAEYILKLDDETIKNSLLTELTQYNLAFSVEKFKKDFPDFVWKDMDIEIGNFIKWHDNNNLFSEVSIEIIEDKLVPSWLRCIDCFLDR